MGPFDLLLFNSGMTFLVTGAVARLAPVLRDLDLTPPEPSPKAFGEDMRGKRP